MKYFYIIYYLYCNNLYRYDNFFLKKITKLYKPNKRTILKKNKFIKPLLLKFIIIKFLCLKKKLLPLFL